MLRWYQQESVTALWNYIHTRSGNPCVAIPTGGGKSYIIAAFCYSLIAAYPSCRILMATHTKEIVKQNAEKLMSYWSGFNLGIYSSGLRSKQISQITFGGIASLINADLGHIDCLIVDECHMISMKETSMYHKLINKLKSVNPELRTVGLTATPYRMGQGLITDGGILTDICYDLTSIDNFNRLVNEGHLCKIVAKRTKTFIDTSEIGKQNGDFKQNELQAACDIESITRAAIEEVMEQCHDRKSWLAFCAGISHAENVSACFESFGVSSTFVHSKMPENERDIRIQAFRNGEYRVICNNGVLTTGFDHPEIDAIIMLRPTSSVPLWLQMAGRGLRTAHDKQNCMLLDFGRNCERLGPINDPRIPKKKNPEPGEIPVKICPKCNAYHHTTVRICDNCAYVFPIKTDLQTVASEAEIMVDVEPVIEELKVKQTLYYKHNKKGSKPSLRVDYVCGPNKVFSEYICLEHDGYARQKAALWWNKRTLSTDIPITVDIAIDRINEVKRVSSIKVVTNRKFPVILEHSW